MTTKSPTPRKAATSRFGRRIKSSGYPGPVILGHEPAPGRHHGLGRLRAPGAVGVAVAAIITQPGFRGFQQLVFQAELEITVNFPWKGVVTGGQRTGGGTVAALHAGFHVPGPKSFDLAVQIRADIFILHNLPLESSCLENRLPRRHSTKTAPLRVLRLVGWYGWLSWSAALSWGWSRAYGFAQG